MGKFGQQYLAPGAAEGLQHDPSWCRWHPAAPRTGPGQPRDARAVLDAVGSERAVIPMLVAGSGFEFEDRGEHELTGVPGAWQLFAVRP